MTFGEWILFFMIWVPLMLLWVFSLVDIFQRRDLSGWAKALWVVAIFVIPWIGVLAYLVTRPQGEYGAYTAHPYEGRAYAPVSVTPRPTSTVQELERLASLRSKGMLTEEEYAAAKSSIISATEPGSKAA